MDKQCEGSCGKHVGNVVRVHITNQRGYDWGEFNYCEKAIETDIKQGLDVEIVKKLKFKEAIVQINVFTEGASQGTCNSLGKFKLEVKTSIEQTTQILGCYSPELIDREIDTVEIFWT
jgi:hypothetical protein